MENKRNIKRKWLIYAVSGLLLIGFGLSLVGEAIIAKINEEPWFFPGTLALIVFNSGISVFGQAVIYRWQYLQEKR